MSPVRRSVPGAVLPDGRTGPGGWCPSELLVAAVAAPQRGQAGGHDRLADRLQREDLVHTNHLPSAADDMATGRRGGRTLSRRGSAAAPGREAECSAWRTPAPPVARSIESRTSHLP